MSEVFQELARQRYHQIKAISEEIPPFAACYVSGVVRRNEHGLLLYVKKPDDESPQHSVIFNGPMTIPPGGIGAGTMDFPCIAQVHGSAGVNSLLSAKSGSWQLEAIGDMFIVLGVFTDGYTTFPESALAYIKEYPCCGLDDPYDPSDWGEV